MALKVFYDYQNNIWRRAVRIFKNGIDPFIIALTGCGKTTILRAFLTHVIRNEICGIKRAIVVTPQNQIKHGFLKHDQRWVVAGAEMEYMQPHHLRAKDLKAFLTGKQTGIAVCCNLALTNPNARSYNPFNEMDDCSDIVLVIDEAHHMEAPGLKALTTALEDRGGRVVYATATPFNAKGLLDVLTSATKRKIQNILYTLGEHMANGHCPRIVLEHRHMHGDAQQTSFRGASYNVKDALLWAESVSLKWTEDGCPKLLVIIPATRSGDENKTTHDTAAVLIEELRTRHPMAKILNAVGSDADKTIHVALQAESEGRTDHDIIVACKRFDEGTDVEALCAVYVIGLCSTRLAIQRMGRALRNKKHLRGFAEKHPNYMDQSKLVFFPLPGFELDGTGFAAEAVKMIAAVENYASYNLIVGATKLKGMIRGNGSGTEPDGNGSHGGNGSGSGSRGGDNDTTDTVDSDNDDDDEIETEIDNVVLKAIMSGSLSPKDLLLLQDAFENNKSMKDVMASASSDMKDLLNVQLLGKALRDPELASQILALLRRSSNKNKAMSEVLSMLAVRFEKEEVEAPNGKSKKDYVSVLGSEVVANWSKIIGMAVPNKEKLAATCHELCAVDRQAQDVKAICEFKTANSGREPSTNSVDPEEKKLGYRLSNFRRSKKGKGLGKLYSGSLSLAESFGYPTLFEPVVDFIERQCNYVRSICEFKKLNGGRTPNKRSKDKEERHLGNRLSKMKRVFAGSSSGNLYVQAKELAAAMGYPDLFAPPTLVQKQLELVQDIHAFKVINGRYPRTNSRCLEDPDLGRGYANLKVTYTHKDASRRRGIIYPETLSLIDKLGCWDMFNPAKLGVPLGSKHTKRRLSRKQTVAQSEV